MFPLKPKALLDGNLVDADTINLKLHAFYGTNRHPTAIEHRPYLEDSCNVCHKFFHGDRRYSEIESCWRAGHFDIMSYKTIEVKQAVCGCPSNVYGHRSSCRYYARPKPAPTPTPSCSYCACVNYHKQTCVFYRK
jgi:hypothetical protein